MFYSLSFPADMESDTFISAQNIHVITPRISENISVKGYA